MAVPSADGFVNQERCVSVVPRRQMRANWLEPAFVLVLALVTLSPAAAILILSFDVSEIGDPYRFGLRGWRSLVTDPGNLKTFFYSFALTVRVPVGLCIALVSAWLIVRVRVPGHRYFEYMFWFAYFLPALPMLNGWILLLDQNFGLINSWVIWAGLADGPVFNIHSAAGIIWVHLSLQTVPILVILIAPALRMIDRKLDDAAIVAGSGSFAVLRYIVLPLALPALFVAGLASWIKALESFEVEQILGVPAGINVYSNKIYEFVTEETPRFAEAMAFSSVFLFFLIGLALYYQRQLRRRGNLELFSGQDSRQVSNYSARIKWAGAAFLLIYLGIAVLMPFVMLICGSFMQLFGFFDLADVWTTDHWVRVLSGNEFRQSAVSTIVLGLSTAVPGTILFAAVAWALSGLSDRYRDAASILVWLPWAFPGLVLGVGLLEMSLSMPGFKMLHGTIYPLILGILIKELPISVHILRTSIQQTNREHVMAARIAGANWLTTFRKIVLPLNAPTLIVVFLLIFAGASKEISTIILVAPPGVQTLSLVTFKYMSLSQFEAATVVGTIVALLALVVSALAYRMSGRMGQM